MGVTAFDRQVYERALELLEDCFKSSSAGPQLPVKESPVGDRRNDRTESILPVYLDELLEAAFEELWDEDDEDKCGYEEWQNAWSLEIGLLEKHELVCMSWTPFFEMLSSGMEIGRLVFRGSDYIYIDTEESPPRFLARTTPSGDRQLISAFVTSFFADHVETYEVCFSFPGGLSICAPDLVDESGIREGFWKNRDNEACGNQFGGGDFIEDLQARMEGVPHAERAGRALRTALARARDDSDEEEHVWSEAFEREFFDLWFDWAYGETEDP